MKATIRWRVPFLLALAALAASVRAQTTVPATQPDRVVIYGGDQEYPPYEYLDQNGQPRGFHVDLMRAIGEVMGFEVEFRLKPWNQVVEDMRLGKVEVAAMFRTAERSSLVDFASPHAVLDEQIFVRKGTGSLPSLHDLDGKQVIVERGAFAHEYLAAHHSGVELVFVDSEPDALRLLASGKHDAALITQIGGFSEIARYRLTNLMTSGPPLLPREYALAVRKGNTELLGELDQGLEILKQTGRYYEIYDEWFAELRPRELGWQETVRYGAWILIPLAVLALGALGWSWTLRRQVLQRTAQLRSELAERQRAEQALRKSEEQYRRTVETAEEGIWIIDAHDRTVFANARIGQMLGYSPEEMIGLPLTHFVFEQDHAMLARKLGRRRQGLSEHHDFRYRRKDGGELWAIVSTNAILDESGNYSGSLAMLTDITERKQIERDLNSAKQAAEEANRAKDHFLAVLSHELRTPLTPVLSAVTSLQRENVPGDLAEALELIRRNVAMEARLIDDLLDLTRISKGKLRLDLAATDLHDAVRRAVELCRSDFEQKHLRLRLNLQAKSHHVNGDATRLQQVVWNLVGNAVKFTPDGGEISVRSSNESKSVVLSVSDSGAGISGSMLERLFTAFEQGVPAATGRPGGLGLGLAISKSIVQMHGGQISAASAGEGRGATFTFSLPTIESPRPQPSVEIAPAPPNGPLKILLVEDNPDTLHVMKRLLLKLNHEVTAVDTLSAARKAAANEQYDLLISDIGMPDGSGLDLMRELAPSGIIGIAVSGYGMDEDIQKSTAAGFAEHLTKPIDFVQLEQSIAHWSRHRDTPATPHP